MVEESQRKDKRKTAKRIIKLAKKHPEWYTKEDVKYAKYIRKSLKKKHYATGEVSNGDSESGGDDGLRGESQQPEQPRQPKRSWFTKLLYQARSLVGLRASTHDGGD
tara:strand:- start:2792 stop:3112 length:321 start_codon:yes stop_codon:yes gene_type:complete